MGKKRDGSQLIDFDPNEYVPNSLLDYDFLLNRQIDRVAMLLSYPRTYEDLCVAEHGVNVLQALMYSKLRKGEYEHAIKKLDLALENLKKKKKKAEWEVLEKSVMHNYLFRKFEKLIKFGTKEGVFGIKGERDYVSDGAKRK